MAKDVNLALITGAVDMAGTGAKGSVVDTEGGFWAMVRMLLGTCTGTTVVVSVAVQASIDGGSNYYHIGQFPILDESDDDIVIARPVYIPRPASGQTVTKVRLNTVVSSGSTPVVPVNRADLEPLVSLGIPAVDAELTEGVEKLV
ncbi:hypothetical protein LCGC14_1160890 [marine sediment metagenome]|uniref:Uncharacterized protein n=1 Tax=marine sediment metagenome TaxID=412755 RepID=A0A0F9PYA7_9ZZZZ